MWCRHAASNPPAASDDLVEITSSNRYPSWGIAEAYWRYTLYREPAAQTPCRREWAVRNVAIRSWSDRRQRRCHKSQNPALSEFTMRLSAASRSSIFAVLGSYLLCLLCVRLLRCPVTVAIATARASVARVTAWGARGPVLACEPDTDLIRRQVPACIEQRPHQCAQSLLAHPVRILSSAGSHQKSSSQDVQRYRRHQPEQPQLHPHRPGHHCPVDRWVVCACLFRFETFRNCGVS